TYDFEVKGRAEAGVRDTFGGALAFNAPVIDDTLAVRFSAEHRTTDGFFDNPTLGTDDAGFDELTTVRAKMLFEPRDDLSFILSGSFSSARTGIAGALLSDLPDRRLSPADEESEEGNDTGILNLRGSWDLSDSLTLESETVGLLNDAIRLQDISGPAPTGFLRVEEETRSWSQELRLRYDSERMAGVIGGFVTDITSRNTQSVSFPVNFILPFLPADVQLLNSFDSTTETFNFAFFGEAEIEVPEVVDGFSVIVGGRYDRETDTSNTVSSTEISRPIDLPIPLPPSSTDELEATFDAFLPKVGFVYDWTDDLSTGVTVQRGYRAGGSIRNGVTGEVSDFDPEFTWNYEFALRSQWFDQRLTANANVFYTQWRDQQVVLPGDTGIPIDVIAANAGKSRLFGGELTLEALPVPELALFGSVAVSDTKFIDFVSGPDDFTGNRFNDAPVVSAAIGGEYFFDNGIVLGADVSYTGAAFGDVDNNPENRVDGYFLVNASIGYEEENWSVELYARNLLDNEYLVSRDVDDGFGLPGEPLTVGLIGTFRF
ncbi:MAG: TonB-dependent receptor, partial [Pseudomonadota bacterium]